MRKALEAALGLALVVSAGLWLAAPASVTRSLAAAVLLEQWVVPAAPLLLAALALLWGGRLAAGVGVAAAVGLLGLVFSAQAALDARLDVGHAGPAGLLTAVAIALVHGAISLAALARLRRDPALRKSSRAGLAGAAAVLWLFLAFLFSPVLHGLHGSVAERPTANGRVAIGNVRTLVACAEAARQEAPERGYPRDVDGLAGVCPDARRSLIDTRGYRLTYAAKAAAGSGAVTGFAITARPVRFGRTGRVSVLADETGVVRRTLEDRPARADDPGE